MDTNEKREEQVRRNLVTEGEELQQATTQFVRSLFRAGASLVFLPMNMLPDEPRQHFQTAGREFARGLSTLVHEFADELEKMAEEPKEPTEDSPSV